MAELRTGKYGQYYGSVWGESKALNQTQMEINAKYIFSYLTAEGWTINAIAGILGNMQYESSLNPGRWQGDNIGVGPAYGIVQWDPWTKYVEDWCYASGYADPSEMDTNLARIIWELDTGAQYYKNYYPYTFKTFIKSTDSPYTLACAFAFDYERSGVVINGSEEEKEALRQRRGNSAVSWFEYLSGSDISHQLPIINSFNLLNTDDTSATFELDIEGSDLTSFEVFCYINDIQNSKLNVTSGINSIIINALLPNTSYEAKIVAKSAESETVESQIIMFSTQQSYPDAVKSIKIQSTGKNLETAGFRVTVTKPDSFGYWGSKKNTTGYRVYIISNGKLISNFDITSKPPTIDITPNNYGIKHGTNLQVGISTWAENDNGNKVFSLPGMGYPVCSNSICLKDASEEPDTLFLVNSNIIRRAKPYMKTASVFKPLRVFKLRK